MLRMIAPSRENAGSAKYHQCGCMSSAMVSLALRFFFGYGMVATVVIPAGRADEPSRTRCVWCRGMTTDRLLHGLDAQQRRAVETDAHPLAIVATAGSGKTMVLTRRIAYRIAQGQADASHVVALT